LYAEIRSHELHQISMRRLVLGLAVALGVLAPSTIHASANNAVATTATFGEIGNLDRDVLELALGAATCAVRSGAVKSPRTITVIDYSRPSSQERLWVFDLKTGELMYEELVAHGQGTGADRATKFSNTDESHQTSLGLFVTDTTYVGKNGYSLRLEGLDKGFNDRARERAIVMHGAPYVSETFVKANGRLGRSWGCPAVSDAVARELIDRVKGGNLVFAYYPDGQWLKTSKYLGGCLS
jgi:L,D-transpeptidase-like protein